MDRHPGRAIPEDLGEMSDFREWLAKHGSDAPHLADPAFLLTALGMLCLIACMSARSLKGRSLLALRDPSLAESLAFQNM